MDEIKNLAGAADATASAPEAAPAPAEAEEKLENAVAAEAPETSAPEPEVKEAPAEEVPEKEAAPAEEVKCEAATPETAEEAAPAEDAPATLEAEGAEEAEGTGEDAEETEEGADASAPLPANKQEVIERLKNIVYDKENVERQELERLKMLYYRYHNAEVLAAREAFLEGGGEAEAFMPPADPTEEDFKAQYALIREMRNQAARELEAEKQKNLERKQQIIERLKELAASPEAADKGFEEFSNLRNEWKEIKVVPAENATELWKNYQLYVEQFYDQLHLNHEMRAYDFKKNLEIKTHLCEAAEKLADTEDVISAFHQLQKLHQEFRETGPVSKELREEIWKRFKEASTVVNKRHQEHFENLKAREEENLRLKTALCEKAEAIDLEAYSNHAAWEQGTREVMDMQSEWKTIGFTPRKVNAEIFERFRTACDRFFQAKTAWFKANREKLAANLAAKTALIEKAEALKESTDWGATTAKFVELQKEWKTIGPVAHKVSDNIWKRFNEACNFFFEKKNEATAGQRKEEEANLELKKAVISELAQIAEEPVENQLQAVRDLQARWSEIGHVPYNKKEKMYRRYRELCDKIYDALHETAGRRRMDSFRKKAAEKEGSELARELTRLQNALEAKKQEVKNYETNLTFFRSSSKKGNSIVADIEKKIERLKQEAAEIIEKMKAVKEAAAGQE